MAKQRVGDMKGEEKFTFEAGSGYRFKVSDFKVIPGDKTPGGHNLVVVDVMCIGGTADEANLGRHTELTFSMSPAAKGITHAWLEALGFSDEDVIETDDPTGLEGELRTHAKGAIVVCDLVKEKRGDYWQNKVNPPWQVELSQEIDTDFKGGEAENEKAPF